MKKITDLEVLDHYRVRLRFNDGVRGEVDFASKPRTGGFSYWNNYDDFRRARIGGCGEPQWNDQLDFCPDSLWLQMTGQRQEAPMEEKVVPAPA